MVTCLSRFYGLSNRNQPVSCYLLERRNDYISQLAHPSRKFSLTQCYSYDRHFRLHIARNHSDVKLWYFQNEVAWTEYYRTPEWYRQPKLWFLITLLPTVPAKPQLNVTPVLNMVISRQIALSDPHAHNPLWQIRPLSSMPRGNRGSTKSSRIVPHLERRSRLRQRTTMSLRALALQRCSRLRRATPKN